MISFKMYMKMWIEKKNLKVSTSVALDTHHYPASASSLRLRNPNTNLRKILKVMKYQINSILRQRPVHLKGSTPA